MRGQDAWDYFADNGPYRFDVANRWRTRPEDRVESGRVELISRTLHACGACGGATYAWTDSNGQTHVETHASGIYGSDVPCDGSGW